MGNYNKQQQAVILKGIAQQILSMNVPTFDEVDKLFQMFDKTIEDEDKAIEASIHINDEIKHPENVDDFAKSIAKKYSITKERY